jgi:hypothetical protein
MTTDNICFYLQNRLIQRSQTGGQLYSDTSPFSIPWRKVPALGQIRRHRKKGLLTLSPDPGLSLDLTAGLDLNPE